jgi:hypothetical protein
MNTLEIKFHEEETHVESHWDNADREFLRYQKPLDRLRDFDYKHLPPIDFQIRVGGENVLKRTKLDKLGDRLGLIYGNNVSSIQKVRLTPWIAMHRMMHMIQCQVGHFKNLGVFDEYDQAIHLIMSAYGVEPFNPTQTYWQLIDNAMPTVPIPTNVPPHYFNQHGPQGWCLEARVLNEVFYAVFTMRSARKRLLSMTQEIAAESFAQFFIEGAVRLNPFPEEIRVPWEKSGYGKYPNKVVYTPRKRVHDIDHEEVAGLMNNAFGKLAAELPGKILAF